MSDVPTFDHPWPEGDDPKYVITGKDGEIVAPEWQETASGLRFRRSVYDGGVSYVVHDDADWKRGSGDDQEA